MLSQRQIHLLKAVVNRIIPADEYPDGWEAGVGDYLMHQFASDLSHLLPIYALGLDSLDAEAMSLHHLSFDRLTDVLQDDLLTRIEQGKVTTDWVIDPMNFFRMLIEHCAEGYYSDPANGGNKATVSWKMIGFEVRG